jgi:hypothetical protein
MTDIVTFSTTVNPDDTLEEHAAEIRKGIRDLQTQMCNALHIALMVGRRLNLVKDQVAHGAWNQWLKDNCPIQPRTAKLYIQLADHQGDIIDKIAQDPGLSIRAARRLIAKPIKPAAEDSPNTADDPEASAAAMRAKFAELDKDKSDATPAGRLLAAWEAASTEEQRSFLSTITLDAMLKVMPNAWRPKLEQLVLGNLKSHCTTEKQRDTVRKLEKKRPFIELEATPID